MHSSIQPEELWCAAAHSRSHDGGGLAVEYSMTSALLFTLCLIGQRPAYFPPTVVQPHSIAPRIVDPRSLPNPDAGTAALEQRRFEKSFNHLAETLIDFAEQYNHHRTIDVKKVRAIKKAWRDLEK